MSENTGIWLPEAVLELADLSPTEKMLFAAILPMTFTEPCYAGNDYLGKRIGVSEQTASNNLGTLHNKGYIRVFVDRVGGNKREITTYIHETTLYKYLGEPLSKFDRPLYKDFIEGIQKSYRASIKSLDTLYKNFVFTYKDESKVDNKVESNKTYTPIATRRDSLPFWSALKIEGGIYQDWKVYSKAIQSMIKAREKEDSFEQFWQLYGKKEDRKKCLIKWNDLPERTRREILSHVPSYVRVKPDIQYRKNPLTYLNGECWKDPAMTTQGINQKKHMVY